MYVQHWQTHERNAIWAICYVWLVLFCLPLRMHKLLLEHTSPTRSDQMPMHLSLSSQLPIYRRGGSPTCGTTRCRPTPARPWLPCGGCRPCAKGATPLPLITCLTSWSSQSPGGEMFLPELKLHRALSENESAQFQLEMQKLRGA